MKRKKYSISIRANDNSPLLLRIIDTIAFFPDFFLFEIILKILERITKRSGNEYDLSYVIYINDPSKPWKKELIYEEKIPSTIGTHERQKILYRYNKIINNADFDAISIDLQNGKRKIINQ